MREEIKFLFRVAVILSILLHKILGKNKRGLDLNYIAHLFKTLFVTNIAKSQLHVIIIMTY
jgi:hypothetical protein